MDNIAHNSKEHACCLQEHVLFGCHLVQDRPQDKSDVTFQSTLTAAALILHRPWLKLRRITSFALLLTRYETLKPVS